MARDIANMETLTAKLGVYRTLGERCKPEDDLNIVYKPYGNTVDASKEAAALADDEKMEEFLDAGLLQTLEVVTEWDLMKNGQLVPLTLEGIMEARVPSQVFQEIGEAIKKDMKRQVSKKHVRGKSRD